MIASSLVPQENSIVPDEAGATPVMFAVSGVGPVPQFGRKIGELVWVVIANDTAEMQAAGNRVNTSTRFLISTV